MLAFSEAMAFLVENEFRFGVTGRHLGQFRDLWKYNKVKNCYKPDGSDRQDVLLREFLVDFSMEFIVAAPDKSAVAKLRLAFLRPQYALSAGNSDDIIKIIDVSKPSRLQELPCTDFENTVLPGDSTAVYEPLLDLEQTSITETIRAPQVYLLPTAFAFDGDVRRVIRREPFTFVGSAISLNKPILAVNVAGAHVALI